MNLKPAYSIEPFSLTFGLSGEWYIVGSSNRVWMYQLSLGPLRLALFDYHNQEKMEDGRWTKVAIAK
jgi:hypothetical protein